MNLHDRMYHPSSATMARAVREGAWPGVGVSPAQIERVFRHRECLSCALGKMKRLARAEGSSVKPPFGQEVSVDYLPITTTAKGGFKGAYMFVERSAGYAWAYLISRHDHVRLHQAILHVRSCLIKKHYTLREVRTDAGKVEVTKDLATKLAQDGITINSAAPEAQYQNFVERFIQTAIKGVASTMVSQKMLDNSFWGMALLAWVRAWNCRPNSNSGDYTPEFQLTGFHPDINRQFKYPFGAPVVSRVLQDTRNKDRRFKFAPSGELGYVVGNTESMNGASLVYFPKKGNNVAYPRVDIQLLHIDTLKPTQQEMARLLEDLAVKESGISLPQIPVHTPSMLHSSTDHDENLPFIPEDTSAIQFDKLDNAGAVTSLLDLAAPPPPEPEIDQAEVIEDSAQDVATSSDRNLTTTQEGEVDNQEDIMHEAEDFSTPDLTEDSDDNAPVEDVVDDTPAANTRYKKRKISQVTTSVASTPKTRSLADYAIDNPTLARALKSEHAPQWREAIEKEILNLVDHNTGTEVYREDIPRESQVLPTKCVLKIKRDTRGVPTKFKARLCILGNLQRKSSTSVYSPTVNDKAMKLMLAMATTLDLSTKSLDVFGAFLYPQEKQEVYITMPAILTGNQPVYWKLNKTMYGLSSSPKAFYEHVHQHLEKEGYLRSPVDPCVFYKQEGQDYLIAVAHVDDFAFCASTESMMIDFINHMEKAYVITLTEDVKHLLGINIESSINGNRSLKQPGLLKKLFEKYSEVKKLSKLPVVPMSSQFKDEYQNDAEKIDHRQYMELLGSLLYMVKTRPDIAYAVNRLATRAVNATVKDFKGLLRILAYLYHTQDKGIRFKVNRAEMKSSIILEAYCDAAYACHSDGKSQSGYAFKIRDNEGKDQSGFFYSRSSKQMNVALSSTEAEINAVVECAKDAVWFRDLLLSVGFEQRGATKIYVDNQSMIIMATNLSGNHKKVKHFLTRLNFLMDLVQKKVIELIKIDTSKNVADMLTKPLGPTQFETLRDVLLGNFQ